MYGSGEKLIKSAGESKPLYQMEAEAKERAMKAQSESYINVAQVQDLLTGICSALVREDPKSAHDVAFQLFGLVVRATAAGQVDTHDVAIEARKAFDILGNWPA